MNFCLNCNICIRLSELEEGAEYRIGVMAKNRVGFSQPAVLSQYVKATETVLEPNIEITHPPNYNGGITVNAHEDISISATV